LEQQLPTHHLPQQREEILDRLAGYCRFLNKQRALNLTGH
jgi:hypothetical protein